MKRLLIPFIALTLCTPAVAHKNEDEILEWANAYNEVGRISLACQLFDEGKINFVYPIFLIDHVMEKDVYSDFQKTLVIANTLLIEGGRVKNTECRRALKPYQSRYTIK